MTLENGPKVIRKYNTLPENKQPCVYFRGHVLFYDQMVLPNKEIFKGLV